MEQEDTQAQTRNASQPQDGPQAAIPSTRPSEPISNEAAQSHDSSPAQPSTTAPVQNQVPSTSPQHPQSAHEDSSPSRAPVLSATQATSQNLPQPAGEQNTRTNQPEGGVGIAQNEVTLVSYVMRSRHNLSGTNE